MLVGKGRHIETSRGSRNALPSSSSANMAMAKLFCRYYNLQNFRSVATAVALGSLCLNLWVMTIDETSRWEHQPSRFMIDKSQELRYMRLGQEYQRQQQQLERSTSDSGLNPAASVDMKTNNENSQVDEALGKNKALRCTGNKDDGCEQVIMQACVEKPAFTQFADHRPRNLHREQGLEGFLEGTAISTQDVNQDADLAVCRFLVEREQSWHFPHAMEQLYSCWSFWQMHQTQQPVLLYEYGHDKHIFPSGSLSQEEKMEHFRSKGSVGFLPGALLAFMEAFHVQLVTEVPDGTPLAQPKWSDDDHKAHAMLTPAHAHALTNGIVDFYQLEHSRAGCPAEQPADWSEVWPKIQIVNGNAQTARMLNVDQLAEAIGNVPIVSFDEETRFLDQVAFFDSTDIVVGPHGAQLTGVALMPTCGAVLALFPQGYRQNDSFGSLAEAAGLDYSAYHVSDSPENRTQSQEHQQVAQGLNMCPDVALLVNELNGMVDSWRNCCRLQLEG